MPLRNSRLPAGVLGYRARPHQGQHKGRAAAKADPSKPGGTAERNFSLPHQIRQHLHSHRIPSQLAAQKHGKFPFGHVQHMPRNGTEQPPQLLVQPHPQQHACEDQESVQGGYDLEHADLYARPDGFCCRCSMPQQCPAGDA